MTVLEKIHNSSTEHAPISTVKHRSKGELTRERILIAAIEVLAVKGIKGTTHRAIASHAKLQLSLTTYYFKDIQELIHQAFKLNSKFLLSNSHFVFARAFDAIEDIPKTDLRKVAVKQQLCTKLANIASDYLLNQITEKRVYLAVEQLMFTELQVTPALKALTHSHELSQLKPFEQLCRYFNKTDAELDAKLMRTIFTQLKYSLLNSEPENIDHALLKQTAEKVLSWVMRLK